MRERVSGIYLIRNIHTGRSYIGKAVDIQRRWADHRRDLFRGVHGSPELQKDWTELGESAFEFTILEEVSGEDALADAEAHHWATADNPYNAMIVSVSRNFESILRKSKGGRELLVKWYNQLHQTWERQDRERKESMATSRTPSDQLCATEQAERESYLAIWKPRETAHESHEAEIAEQDGTWQPAPLFVMKSGPMPPDTDES